MSAEETNAKDDKTRSEGPGPLGTGMFEMMKKCCAGEGGFPDCAAMMKSRMGAMTGMPCCGPGAEKTGPEGGKK